MSTLSEIVSIDPDLLFKKFDLEPRYRYDPYQKENLVFLSPTVLLEDLEMRDGGLKDRGPKEVLSRLTNDILSAKEHSLFQVPEIPYLHMGYGRKSETKKHNMAITENEAKVWMNFLDLTRHKRDGEVLREHETPMEVDVTFPTPDRREDSHAFEGDAEEMVNPSLSGLKRRVKGSYLMFFSILFIFFKKKKSTQVARDREPTIGANKVSDFLLFWILPYLLNFTHRKLSEINAHHKRKSEEEDEPMFTVPVLEKSTMDIIKDAIQSCQVSIELERTLLVRYRKYYGTDQLNRKYKLPKTSSNTPVILVPSRYQVTDMPVEIEDLGRKKTWQDIGDVHLIDEFVSKFIESKEIQEDFLHSLYYVKDRFAVDYEIIVPDEDTFDEVIGEVENEHPDIFCCQPEQGLNLAPRIGLVKHTERHQSVCFSYFPERKGQNVATLFRVVGSHRLNHFTLVLLHGSCINSNDPYCKLLSLYPVGGFRRFSFKGGKLEKRKSGEEKKNEVVGKFCKMEFPETFQSWRKAIDSDKAVTDVVSRSKLNYPEYVRKSLLVAYAKKKHEQNLKNSVFGASVAQTTPAQDRKSQIKRLKRYKIRAANLDGCLLDKIASYAHPQNVGVVLAINDTLEPFGACLPSLPGAMKRVITHFVRAVVVAGLPAVYTPQPDEGNRDDKSDDSDSSEDDDESSSFEVPSTARGATSSGNSGTTTTNSSSETGQRIKQGTPTRDELELLGLDIGGAWIQLGRRLEIEDERLEEIREANVSIPEKGYQMLKHWKQEKGSAATFQVLCQALQHKLVNRQDLAEKHCYEQQ